MKCDIVQAPAAFSVPEIDDLASSANIGVLRAVYRDPVFSIEMGPPVFPCTISTDTTPSRNMAFR
jgi:hypothetical protein